MHFSTLISMFLASCALAAPSASGENFNDLSKRGDDFTLKWHNSNTCTGPGPERKFDAGACIPLGADARGVEIIWRRAGCYLVSYSGSSCSGNPRELDNNGCWTLKDKRSVGFRC